MIWHPLFGQGANDGLALPPSGTGSARHHAEPGKIRRFRVDGGPRRSCHGGKDGRSLDGWPSRNRDQLHLAATPRPRLWLSSAAPLLPPCVDHRLGGDSADLRGGGRPGLLAPTPRDGGSLSSGYVRASKVASTRGTMALAARCASASRRTFNRCSSALSGPSACRKGSALRCRPPSASSSAAAPRRP